LDGWFVVGTETNVAAQCCGKADAGFVFPPQVYLLTYMAYAFNLQVSALFWYDDMSIYCFPKVWDGN